MDSNQPSNSKYESAASQFAIGSVAFEKYEILDFIDSGGAGRVYKARDKVLNNIVALKVLIPDGKNELALLRFHSEARTSSKLNHPNIASIMDFGVASNVPYLTMEFVEGRSLQELLKQEGELSLQDFFDIFIQLCEAIEYAHTRSIVHRDIKPSNIIIRVGADEIPVPKILDFGIAKRLDASPAEDGKLTPTGEILGSPLYMSPEQCRGIPVTEKTDIYSLGCVMWQCITGAPPFQGESAMQIVLQHINNVPEKLSVVCADKDIPEDLCSLVDRMLSKDPADRPGLSDCVLPTLKTLREQLDLFEPEETEVSKNDDTAGNTTAVFTTNRERRNRNLTIGVFVVGFCAVSIFIATFALNETKQDSVKFLALDEIVGESEKAQIDAHKAKTIARAQRGQLVDMRYWTDEDLPKIKNCKNLTAVNLSSSLITDEGLKYISKWPVNSLNLSKTQVRTLAGVESLKNTLGHLDLRATDIDDESIERLRGLTKLEYLSVSDNKGITDRGVLILSTMKQLKSIDLSKTKITGRTLIHLANLKGLFDLNVSGTPVTAKQLEELLVKSESIDHIKVLDCPNISGTQVAYLRKKYPCTSFGDVPSLLTISEKPMQAAADKGDSRTALPHKLKSLEYVKQQFGADSYKAIYHFMGAGQLANNIGLDSEAEKYLKNAIQLCEKYGDTGRLALTLESYAVLVGKKGNYAKAEALFNQAAEANKKSFGPYSQQLDDLYWRAADFYTRHSQFEKVANYYQKSAAIRYRLHGKNPGYACALLLQAESLRRLKKISQTKPLYDEGLSIMESATKLGTHQLFVAQCAYAGATEIEIDKKQFHSAFNLNEKAWALTCRHPKLQAFQLVYDERMHILKELKRSDLIETTRETYERLTKKQAP